MRRLHLCEKPSQAEALAKVLGGARKASTHWETDGGLVTWFYGHMLELLEPEDYDPALAEWKFGTLPVIPSEFKWVPNRPKDWMKADTKAFIRRSNDQLKAVGGLLRQCTDVVIATDPDRQGEMIARNVLEHFGYRDDNRISRLWLSSADEASVRKALARLKPSRETVNLHWVARALAGADWLVGMNGTRGVTLKMSTKGVVSIGRVQTPTLALVVRRDRAIADFKPRDYFELRADITSEGGQNVRLRHGPKDEEKRIWDRAKADAVASAAAGQRVTLGFTETPMRKGPPKLFTLAALQKEANRRWNWTAKRTLDVAQELYETHKAATYPRTNCEYLPEEQAEDVPAITGNLTVLEAFKHLAGFEFKPRLKTVFNSSKVEAHHAIIPTAARAPLDRMDDDATKLYLVIASRYLCSLLPDYEYLSSKISTVIEELEFSATGTIPTKPGWKVVNEGSDEDEDENKLPRVRDGESGDVKECTVEGKKTEPPSYYTEATLIDDMENIAKYVTDPAQKALLRSTDGKVGSADKGIGTSATRGDIIETLKKRETIETKGKQIRSTEKGRSLVTYLEKEAPALVDPGETAVWEERLGLIAEGALSQQDFLRDMGDRVRALIATLGKLPDTARSNGGSAGGKPTGIFIEKVEVLDCGDCFRVPGVISGKIFKNVLGHTLTVEEIDRLINGGETVEATDFKSAKTGRSYSARMKWKPKAKPYPKVEVEWD